MPPSANHDRQVLAVNESLGETMDDHNAATSPWSDERTSYVDSGMCIIRDAVPPDLLLTLRDTAKTATVLARRERGPQAQRLINVFATPELDRFAFQAFLDLPVLRECVTAVLSADHAPSPVMSVLINPEVSPWMMPWHRDWIDNANDVDTEEWSEAASDLTMFNQVNAPLFDDSSLWFLPYSHARPSTNAELAARQASIAAANHPDPSLDRLTQACAQMPQGEPVRLAPGDVALYRNSSWHAGLYDPKARRATIHTWFEGPGDRRWTARRQARGTDVNFRNGGAP